MANGREQTRSDRIRDMRTRLLRDGALTRREALLLEELRDMVKGLEDGSQDARITRNNALSGGDRQ